jgi:hypothetical protein
LEEGGIKERLEIEVEEMRVERWNGEGDSRLDKRGIGHRRLESGHGNHQHPY